MDSPELSIAVPRTYWLESRVYAVISCGGAFLMVAGHWWPVLFAAKKPSLLDFVFSSAYMLIAAIFTVVTFRSFVRLTENSIKVSRVWGSKVLPFDTIRGRRKYTEKADPYSTPARHLVLESNSDQYTQLNIKVTDKFDEDFYRWFNSLPDLDKLDGLKPPQSKYSNFSLV